MKIECIGYKKTHAFFGEKKMWYYKVVIDGVYYLIVDWGTDKLLDMKWVKNIFVNANFTDKEFEDMNIKSIEKTDVELIGDCEADFFPKTEVEPVVKEVKPPRTNTYTADEINEILNIFNEFDITHGEKTFKVITQEMLDYANEDEDSEFLLDKLLGYKVKYKTDGNHKNDGQMVEYTFTFVSPEGKKTKLYTEMCLMCGWNYGESITIE